MSKDTGKARLPGLQVPRTQDAGLAQWMQSVTERLEVREGARGNPYERALTVRDMVDGGVIVFGGAGGGFRPTPIAKPPEAYGLLPGTERFTKFLEDLRASRLYRDLVARIDDPNRFNDLADEVRSLLLTDITEEAKKRGADIRRIDTKIQTETRSLAMAVTEVTAAVADAQAGVRDVTFAQAQQGEAIAGQITQVKARLDGNDNQFAALEQTMTATASKTAGLEARYTLKVQAGGAIAGFGIAATDNGEGNATSSFVIVADKFAIVSPGYAGSTEPKYVPFGVDGVTQTIYLNGNVRINAGGTTLNQIGSSVTLSATGQVFNVGKDGGVTPSALSVTATLSGGLASSPITWATTPSVTTSVSGNTLTVTAANFGSNTSVKVTASVTKDAITYSDSFTLYRVIDGADALTGFLTNESHAVPADAAGTVQSYAGASGEMVVFKGGTRLTTGVSYRLSSNPNGLSLNLNASTGEYAVTGGLTVDTATVSIRATVGAAAIDKVFTLARQKAGNPGTPGSPGSPGSRGSLTRYGTASSWSDSVASGLFPQPLVMGDTATLSNGGTWAQTMYWSGMSWVTPGVVLDGNLLVSGTLSANKIYGGTLAGASIDINGGNGYLLQALMGANAVSMWGVYSSNISAGSLARPGEPAITGNSSTGAVGVYGEISSWNSYSTSHGVRGRNIYANTSGLVGVANGYDFYAEGGGINYGPFTGAHDALVPCGTVLSIGDIVRDVAVLFKRNVSNTLCEVAATTAPCQKGVVGVVVKLPAPLDPEFLPSAMHLELFTENYTVYNEARRTFEDVELTEFPNHRGADAYLKTHELIAMNALGEGQINVCGEGGNLEPGDLIVSSSMPGKGMRQADDVVRGYTVAKCRETVVFSSPAEVKMVACIYLCG